MPTATKIGRTDTYIGHTYAHPCLQCRLYLRTWDRYEACYQ